LTADQEASGDSLHVSHFELSGESAHDPPSGT
jgi:hypothetical protein